MSNLVPLRSHVSIYEAHNIRNLLAAANIEAVVDGEMTAGALNHVGTAVDARLMVEQADLERATKVLADAKQNAESESDWFCAACQEVVEGSFEVCWSCGGLRAEVEDPTVKIESLPSNSDQEWADHDDRSSEWTKRNAEPTGSIDVTDPFAVRHIDDEPVKQEASTFRESTRTQLNRALKAAVLSAAFLPLQIYSVYLLMTLPVESDWPGDASAKLYLAWTWNGLVFLTWAVLLKMTVGGGF